MSCVSSAPSAPLARNCASIASKVADPEVEHRLLGAGPEIIGPGLECREHRWPWFLTPQAVLIGVQTQAIAVPGAEGSRVSGPHEVPADSSHTFHAAILPAGRSSGPHPCLKAARTGRMGRWTVNLTSRRRLRSGRLSKTGSYCGTRDGATSSRGSGMTTGG